ncbi:DUF3570 domain-containing protein [Kaarinaea lacus]
MQHLILILIIFLTAITGTGCAIKPVKPWKKIYWRKRNCNLHRILWRPIWTNIFISAKKPPAVAPVSAEAASGPKQTRGKDETKTVVDFLFGVTQILDRQSLLQLNYNIGTRNGYLTDPYKILSVVDDNSGLIVNTDPYRFEARLDDRLSQSVYAKYVHQFTEGVIYLTYRYFWDDWDITPHTIDIRYRYELGSGQYLQPHALYYVQSEAAFYKAYLLNSEAGNTQTASADYRLGNLTTTTLGLLYGLELSNQSEFTISVEVMQQSGKEPAKFAALDNQILFPDVDAVIVQAGYSFYFYN